MSIVRPIGGTRGSSLPSSLRANSLLPRLEISPRVSSQRATHFMDSLRGASRAGLFIIKAEAPEPIELKGLDPCDQEMVIKDWRKFAEKELPYEILRALDSFSHLPVAELSRIKDGIRRIKDVIGKIGKSWVQELSDAAERDVVDIVRKIVEELNLQLLLIPEEFGGLGGGARDLCKLAEAMAYTDLGIATAFLAAVGLALEPIHEAGTPEQKAHWFGKVAEGQIAAYSVTEPSAGSDLSGIRSTATPGKLVEGKFVEIPLDGDEKPTHYKIDGQKIFISSGHFADFHTWLARVPKSKWNKKGGQSFFVIPSDTPGLSVARTIDKHGIRLSPTAELVAEDVVVPAEHLLGLKEGKGAKQAYAVFKGTRPMVAAFALGTAQAAIDFAINYSKERTLQDAPAFFKGGLTVERLVGPAIRLEAARAYVEQTVIKTDSGDKKTDFDAAVAKLLATEWGQAATSDAIQVLGGYGYTKEYPVEKMARDVRITTIYEGTSEIQKIQIGLTALTSIRSVKGEKGKYYSPYSVIADEMTGEDFKEFGGDHLSQAARILHDTIYVAYDKDINLDQLREQPAEFLLADMVGYVEAAAALVKKAERLSKEGSPDTKKFEAMARVFAQEASSKVAALAPEVLRGLGILSEAEFNEFPSRDLISKALIPSGDKLNDQFRAAFDIIGVEEYLNNWVKKPEESQPKTLAQWIINVAKERGINIERKKEE